MAQLLLIHVNKLYSSTRYILHCNISGRLVLALLFWEQVALVSLNTVLLNFAECYKIEANKFGTLKCVQINFNSLLHLPNTECA